MSTRGGFGAYNKNQVSIFDVNFCNGILKNYPDMEIFVSCKW